MTAMPSDARGRAPGGAAARPPSLPGDKSISHRALLLALLAEGESRIARGRRRRGRPVHRRASWRRSGATVERVAERAGRVDYRVVSPGRRRPGRARGRSSTAATPARPRAWSPGSSPGRPLFAVLDGDASLRRRPMGRVVEPLRAMGATFAGRGGDTLLPLAVTGRARLSAHRLHGRPSPAPRSSRRSCWRGWRPTARPAVTEAVATRDHTERMLRARGVAGARGDGGRRRAHRDAGGPGARRGRSRRPCPADPSGAAFWLVAGGDPSRRRAAPRGRQHEPDAACHHRHPQAHGRPHRGDRHRPAPGGPDGEPLADLVVRSSELRGIDLSPAEVAAAIDEIPILAPGRGRGVRHDAHPGRRRAPPQGVRPRRGDRGRPGGPRRGHPRRGRRHRDPAVDAG